MSYILCSFSLYCVSLLLTLSVQFSFLLSWVPSPFVPLTFNNHLYQTFAFCFPMCLLFFFYFFHPLSISLSLLLKMMPLIKRMVRSSHSAPPATTYSCFSFFFLFFSLTSFQSMSTPLVAMCGHSAPCCQHYSTFNPHLYHCPTQHIMNQINHTSKIIFCYTV